VNALNRQARAWSWSGVRHRRLLQIGGRAGRAEREIGEGGRLDATRRKENGRKRGAGRGTTAWTVGSGWLQEARSEVAARAHGGGGLANRGGRWGMGGASVSGRCRQAGPTSTVPGGFVQTRF
jgi:hypothetical protein